MAYAICFGFWHRWRRRGQRTAFPPLRFALRIWLRSPQVPQTSGEGCRIISITSLAIAICGASDSKLIRSSDQEAEPVFTRSTRERRSGGHAPEHASQPLTNQLFREIAVGRTEGAVPRTALALAEVSFAWRRRLHLRKIVILNAMKLEDRLDQCGRIGAQLVEERDLELERLLTRRG